jgi:ADP-L-glycero-D-manno-heptose 6-epimerase
MIIVTGAAGFIGSCFVSKLNQEGMTDLVLVDVVGDISKKKNLEGKKFSEYLEKDCFIQDIAQDRMHKKCEAVFHIGACSSTTESNEEFLIRNNLEYSKTLARWALSNHIPFHYASSAATYGDGALGYSDQDEITPKLKALNLYGKSKLQFDQWIIQNKLTDKVVGWRYFNVFGPNEYHKDDMRSVVAKAYDQITQTGKLKLFKSYKKEFKDGEQKRDFVYIKDVIRVMWEIFQARTIHGIFNLGTGEARTWNDLAKAVFTSLGKPVHIEYIDMPDSIKNQYQYFTQADLTKLRSTGCRYRFTPLEQSVGDYVEYLKATRYL